MPCFKTVSFHTDRTRNRFIDSWMRKKDIYVSAARKTLAEKLQNPRLLRISFHTLRHRKATMLYHQTHNPWYVKQFSGNKSLSNAEIYINIEQTLFAPSNDEFTVIATDNPEEIKSSLKVGFDYMCQKDGLVSLCKRN